jgi:hypothetical protein
LSPGDIVYAVNRTSVSSLEELRAIVDALKPATPLSSTWSATAN